MFLDSTSLVNILHFAGYSLLAAAYLIELLYKS